MNRLGIGGQAGNRTPKGEGFVMIETEALRDDGSPSVSTGAWLILIGSSLAIVRA